MRTAGDSSTQWVEQATADAGAVALGLLSGWAGAAAYYSPSLRPLAHTFGLWIVVVVLLSAGQPALQAVRGSFLGLMSAVLAFYVGLKIYYLRRYETPFSVEVDSIVLYGFLAMAAATVLGSAFRRIGGTGWPGALGTSAAVGLLVGDALRRTRNYPQDRPVVLALTVVGLAVVWALTSTRGADLWRAAVLTPPATIVGLVLVAGPDGIEQLLLR